MVEKQLSEEDIILDDIVTGPYKYGFNKRNACRRT